MNGETRIPGVDFPENLTRSIALVASRCDRFWCEGRTCSNCSLPRAGRIPDRVSERCWSGACGGPRDRRLVRDEAVTGDDVVVIGDAAMAGDPLAGEGVTWSVNSGLRAAEIVLDRSKDRTAALANYCNTVAAGFTEFLSTRSALYGRVTRWPNSVFWSRRHQIPSLI
jgi:hypothetical protein